MKAVIVGSGLVGLTSAWFLAQRGWEVTVIDRQNGPGLETSLANGALLTPSMPEPWNAPGSWQVLLRSLCRSDSALKLRLKALPALGGWGLEFLRNSNPTIYERNTLKNLFLALYSLKIMGVLRRETGIEYDHAARGTLRVFRDTDAFQSAVGASKLLEPNGLTFRQLARAETVALEPALAPIANSIVGGIHYPHDEVGNAHAFCIALTGMARRRHVEFHFNTRVTDIHVKSGRVTAVIAGPKRFSADQYIIAAGSYTPLLLQRTGISVPVQPVKGYSVTLDRPGEDHPLRIPVVDDSFHAAIVPLSCAIRVAGTAEFSGYDLSLPRTRIQGLLLLLRQVLPKVRIDEGTARPWCGLRPMSPDGVPIIGPTPLGGLWINTGHGHLGWTMAAGSAEVLSHLISGETPAIDAEPYSLERFTTSREPRIGPSPVARTPARDDRS
jgi:D-amino-acid dehydrogenase